MNKFFKWAGIVFVTIIGISVLVAIFSDDKKTPAKETTTAKVAVENKQPEKPADLWSYDSDTDKMTSKVVYRASIDATKEIELQFPYAGGSVASINVRTKESGVSVFLYVTKGQLMAANAVESGFMNVRFDNDKAEPYSVSAANDGSANYLFINSTTKFLNRLKTAKWLLIETEFFNDGTRQIEFNTAGFTWNH